MIGVNDYKSACATVFNKLSELGPFDGNPSAQSQKIIAEISRLLASIPFRQFLARQPQVLGHLARKSYMHENGFLKLTLVELPNERFRIRLHLWPSATSDSSGNIHNHRFNYYSYLLSGSLRNKVWKTGVSGDEFMHFRYYPRLKQESYILEHCGDACLETLSDSQYYEGDVYCMRGEDLHTAQVAVGTDTVTLFIEERSNLAAHADVFSSRYPEKQFSQVSPALSPSEYLRVLGRIRGGSPR